MLQPTEVNLVTLFLFYANFRFTQRKSILLLALNIFPLDKYRISIHAAISDFQNDLSFVKFHVGRGFLNRFQFFLWFHIVVSEPFSF